METIKDAFGMLWNLITLIFYLLFLLLIKGSKFVVESLQGPKEWVGKWLRRIREFRRL